MGGFGNIARTIGGVGNEVMAAQTGLQDLNQKLTENKLKNLMDQLKIQQTQQAIKKGETDPLEQQAAAAEKVLGRKLSTEERKVLVGLAPVPPTQTIDKTSLRAELLGLANDDKATAIERRVYTSLLQDIDAGGDLKEIMGKKQAFQSSRAEVSSGEGKPVVETFNNQRWQFDPGKNITGKRDATGQYVLLGTAKEETAGAGGKEISDWADDLSSGQITVSEVPSKVRGDVLHYMTLHKQTVPTGRKEAEKAASDVSRAFLNWQNRSAALNKISWIHPIDRSLAKQATDDALLDLQTKARDAVDAFGKAGMPAPQWLQNYATAQPNPANLVPVK